MYVTGSYESVSVVSSRLLTAASSVNHCASVAQLDSMSHLPEPLDCVLQLPVVLLHTGRPSAPRYDSISPVVGG